MTYGAVKVSIFKKIDRTIMGLHCYYYSFSSLQSLESQSSVDIDRKNDNVYSSTTAVVRAVMDMTRGVQQAKADQYIELVKVGQWTRYMTPWWPLLVLLTWYLFIKSSQCNSFEDQVPVDEIYGYLIFKWVALTWQGWELEVPRR